MTPGMVNLVPSVAYPFSLNLPEKFSQPGDHLLAQPFALATEICCSPRGNSFKVCDEGAPHICKPSCHHCGGETDHNLVLGKLGHCRSSPTFVEVIVLVSKAKIGDFLQSILHPLSCYSSGGTLHCINFYPSPSTTNLNFPPRRISLPLTFALSFHILHESQFAFAHTDERIFCMHSCH